jgi:hypothetical protein
VPDEVSPFRLRALLAHADGDDGSYKSYRDGHRASAAEWGFKATLAVTEATT